MIKKIKGNIFNTSAQVIVNTVNCVGVMGRGIALECKLRYPEMFKKYKNFCDLKKIEPGVLQIWKESHPWILNFPTKVHWKDPSKFEYLEKGLDKFINTYSEKEITSIAFPLLGSSLGGLPEQQVFDLMKSKLENLRNIDIEIYEYDPNSNDNLYKKFYQKVYRFSLDDYKKNLNLNSTAASNLKNAIDNDLANSMLGIQDIPKIGLKSLENIHNFLNEDKKILIQSELDLI